MTSTLTPYADGRTMMKASSCGSRTVLGLTIGAVLVTACSDDGSIGPRKNGNSAASATTRGTVNSKHQPVFELDLSDPAQPRVRQGSAAELSAHAAGERERVMSDPAFIQRQERLHAVVGRGLPLVAVQREPLPDGAVALVISDPAIATGRMIVVSETTLSDDVLARARHALLTHELRPESDAETAQLTLWADGRVRTKTAAATTESSPDVRLFNQKRKAWAQAIIDELPQVPPSRITGLGTVRVINLSTLRRSPRGG